MNPNTRSHTQVFINFQTQVNESLARKIAMRNDFDKTIAETEGAYKKVGY